MNAVTIAGAIAVIMAPPTPWNAREPIRVRNEPVRSGRNPHKNEPMVNMIKPVKKILLNPIKSDIFPKIRTQPAITRR